MNSVEQQLRQLGDPSGRQDSAYWDGWFRAICREQAHRPFEWYCSADEVCRVVAHHLPRPSPPPPHPTLVHEANDKGGTNETESITPSYVMIHPGSGTSLVPVALRSKYPTSRQIVLDISRVALDEMQDFHDQQTTVTATTSSVRVGQALQPIEYIEADLLQTTSDDDVRSGATIHGIVKNTCDVWIDKGFVDAIFSSGNQSINRHQSAVVFQTANQLLVPKTGVAIVVSLAEQHSLQLIVENWCRDLETTWEPTLHIWELDPLSGEVSPLAFVLTKRNTADTAAATITTVDPGGSRLGDVPSFVVWHGLRDETQQHHKLSSTHGQWLDEIQSLILAARRSRSVGGDGDDTVDVVDDKARKVLALIEVKPYDTEEDLAALSERLCEASWISGARVLLPQWRPFPDTTNLYHIVPIGFGISKVQLQCIIPSDDMDELIELMQGWDEEVIQSVDVDWSKTVPLGRAVDTVPKPKEK